MRSVAERWVARIAKVERLLEDPAHDPEDLEDARSLASSCAAYLLAESPERRGEIEETAARFGLDIEDGARRNEAQHRYGNFRGEP